MATAKKNKKTTVKLAAKRPTVKKTVSKKILKRTVSKKNTGLKFKLAGVFVLVAGVVSVISMNFAHINIGVLGASSTLPKPTGLKAKNIAIGEISVGFNEIMEAEGYHITCDKCTSDVRDIIVNQVALETNNSYVKIREVGSRLILDYKKPVIPLNTKLKIKVEAIKNKIYSGNVATTTITTSKLKAAPKPTGLKITGIGGSTKEVTISFNQAADSMGSADYWRVWCNKCRGEAGNGVYINLYKTGQNQLAGITKGAAGQLTYTFNSNWFPGWDRGTYTMKVQSVRFDSTAGLDAFGHYKTARSSLSNSASFKF
ncbi:MAG: hypothetical protein WCP11_02330 [Candidatus Saccharibacteria bacterium]